MDKIINVLLLTIIFVFDPLAISLVIAANFAFTQAYPKKKYKENLYQEQVEVEKDDFDWEAAEKRMEIIGQNGNDGEHYEDLKEYDLNDDGVLDQDELKAAMNRLLEISDPYIGYDMKEEIATQKKLIKKLLKLPRKN